MTEQLTFAFLPPPGPRARLRAELALHLGQPVDLVITDNRSTLVAARPAGAEMRVRLHHMFLQADPTVVSALARYLEEGDSRAAELLDAYIDRHHHLITRRPRPPRRAAHGRVHDLHAILADLRLSLVQVPDPLSIAWSPRRRRGRRPSRSSITLGVYLEAERLILVHPSLDQSFVPPYFVQWIVYHELLHCLHGSVVREGRRCVHTPAFRADEGKFPRLEAALAFEAQHLDKLLRF